ncbi:hypothetical protein DUNSADRAFT_9428 [Dunaliella salina]|uniref:Encoded protein n=1 Tax=Dunaliella salina TaxID=3046 RepID=A0ABQ7GHF3_DUNSA|nr:hypothetical protein DUNSADRAFT_9428 [Dunaliella salina]|eukprot:KAF5834037.1 hypothetical protein DUNSADRAFT_9428 [Dunaliella salina]
MVALDKKIYSVPRTVPGIVSISACNLFVRPQSSRTQIHRSLNFFLSLFAGPSMKHLEFCPSDLHLYQILTPFNAERSKEWGGKLRMKNELVLKCSLSKGYFDAPGTLAAPLGISKNPADGTLPMVTIVSAAVEHARILPTSQVRQVEPGLLDCARKCLDLVEGDGYLCHAGDHLSLTLCFSKPEVSTHYASLCTA